MEENESDAKKVFASLLAELDKAKENMDEDGIGFVVLLPNQAPQAVKLANVAYAVKQHMKVSLSTSLMG